MKRKEIIFLTLAEIVKIHNDQIQKYGGNGGVRDINLLSSAVAIPHASFSKNFLHTDIFEMASAYTFHISQNQSLIDGNKRTALASALVFLELNGITIAAPVGTLYKSMISLASRKISKSEFANILRGLGNK